MITSRVDELKKPRAYEAIWKGNEEMEVIIKNDYGQVCDEAVHLILQAWEKKNNLVMGLATGQTPLGVYKRLIDLYREGKIDFSQVVAFTLDEYLGLREDHPQSFAFYMENNLYRNINIKRGNIFRLSGFPSNVNDHCRDYEEKIKKFRGIDLQILGIGKNGHIGFNEPSSSFASRTRVKTLTWETINGKSRLYKQEADIPRYCLTMGIGTIMEAKVILLLASGKEKSRAIKEAIEGPVTASVPASILQFHPMGKIIIDEEAASLLSRKDYYRWVYEHKTQVDDFLAKKRS